MKMKRYNGLAGLLMAAVCLSCSDYLKDESSLKNDIIKYPYKNDEIDI